MTVGSYAYLDGEAFVRVALAMDAVASTLIDRRGKDNISLAYLCSPTDVFMRPLETRRESERRWASRPLWMRLVNTMSGGEFCKPNVVSDKPIQSSEGAELDIIECSVSTQGPNYLLAKRLQHWRAMLARQAGVVVSSNIAPATYTHSVTKAKLLKAAYDGTAPFGIEIFPAETSNVVMTGALLDDVFNPQSPSRPDAALAHPMLLFSSGAWHGGMWTMVTSVPSSVVVSALIALSGEYRWQLLAGTATWILALRQLSARFSSSKLSKL